MYHSNINLVIIAQKKSVASAKRNNRVKESNHLVYRRRRKLQTVLSLTCLLGLGACSGKSGGGGAIICSLLSASVDSQALTVGFGGDFLDFIRGSDQNLLQDDTEVNSKIQTTLNDALQAAQINSLLEVSSVQSVPKSDEDDGVRFLSFDGSLAAGVSFLSTVLKNDAVVEQLSDSTGLVQSSPFDFLEDSYAVYPTGKLADDMNLLQASNKQWAYDQFDLASVKTKLDGLSDQKSEVVVAVIDTGVDKDHPALVDILYKQNGSIVGYDFADGDNDADDDQGHGTHCAGIIAAKNVGEDGMVGVAEALAPGKVKIMPVRVLGSDGSGSTANINKGIRWAMNNGADVLSMSLGGGVEFEELLKSNGAESSVIRDAVAAGLIVIVAAGNENCPLGGECEQTTLFVLTNKIKEYTVLPCSYNGTICIGASDPDATLAPYSNFPSEDSRKGVDPAVTANDNKRVSPDMSAPGSAIYSTYPDGTYKFLDGTSMATPYVAGLAALYKLKIGSSQEAGSTPQVKFREVLQAAEASLQSEGDATRSFVGQVDTANFVDQLVALTGGAAASAPAAIPAVSNPQDDTDGGGQAPNLISALCGGA